MGQPKRGHNSRPPNSFGAGVIGRRPRSPGFCVRGEVAGYQLPPGLPSPKPRHCFRATSCRPQLAQLSPALVQELLTQPPSTATMPCLPLPSHSQCDTGTGGSCGARAVETVARFNSRAVRTQSPDRVPDDLTPFLPPRNRLRPHRSALRYGEALGLQLETKKLKPGTGACPYSLRWETRCDKKEATSRHITAMPVLVV